MGGRGSSSFSRSKAAQPTLGRWGLPDDARAITVVTSIGGKRQEGTYYQSETGLLMKADVLGTTHGAPVLMRGASVSAIYRNSVRNGLEFKLLTQGQVDAANASHRQSKLDSHRDIASAELHPNSGKSGIPAKRLLLTKTRAKGGSS